MFYNKLKEFAHVAEKMGLGDQNIQTVPSVKSTTMEGVCKKIINSGSLRSVDLYSTLSMLDDFDQTLV